MGVVRVTSLFLLVASDLGSVLESVLIAVKKLYVKGCTNEFRMLTIANLLTSVGS